MHLLDILNAPTCAAAALTAGGAVAVGLRKVHSGEGDRAIPLMGVMSAAVFAAQMVKFPILPGVGGHLMGGMLAALVLGPWAGVLAMTVVVTAQCLLFYDGGLTVLGANILNMAVIAPLTGYCVYSIVGRLAVGRRTFVVAVATGAWCSVVLASVLAAVELAASHVAPLRLVLPAMVAVHSIIGVGEALITGMIADFLWRVRPELICGLTDARNKGDAQRRILRLALVGVLLAAFFLSPLAVAAPDGLEYVAASLGFDQPPPKAGELALWPGHQVPGMEGTWLGTSISGVFGAVAAMAAAWLVGKLVGRQSLRLPGP